MNHYTGFYVHVLIFVVPVSLECDWNAIPTVWVNVTQSITHDLYDTFSEHMWFLVEVNVMLAWVVEPTSWHADQ